MCFSLLVPGLIDPRVNPFNVGLWLSLFRHCSGRFTILKKFLSFEKRDVVDFVSISFISSLSVISRQSPFSPSNASSSKFYSFSLPASSNLRTFNMSWTEKFKMYVAQPTCCFLKSNVRNRPLNYTINFMNPYLLLFPLICYSIHNWAHQSKRSILKEIKMLSVQKTIKKYLRVK